jgi:hypothetical protein
MYKNFPFYEVAKEAEERIAQGWDVHQKFTCVKCNSRQTIEKPNVFYKKGTCEECRHVTDIELNGCNYMVIAHAKE